MLRYTLFSILLFLGGLLRPVHSQVTIANALPGCLPVASTVGVSCGGGTTQFGVTGNQFIVRNIDGATCCSPSGGDGAAYFQFATLDISNFTDVNISMAYSADVNTSYEDDSPSAPIFGCQGATPPDNSHDQMVFMYSIDGGTFVQSLYVHGLTGADFTGTWTEGPLNGNTLTIRVYAGNKSQAEIFYFENLNITGTLDLSAGPDLNTCGAAPVTLQGSGTGTWSGGAGTFGSTTNPVTTYTPAAGEYGTSVTLTYTGAPAHAGCPVPSDQMVVTVNTPPVPVITGPTAGCNTVTLTASGGGAGATYAWSGGNNPGDATNTFIVSGTYTVTVTSTNGCTATTAAAVTVNTPPVATISGPTNACSSITLTAAGGGTNATYQWNGGSTPTNASNTFTTSGTYTVTVTDSNGCTATSSQAITINPPPVVNITGNTTGCNSVTLTATGGGTGGTYAWSGGNNTTSATNTFTTSGTYTVTVTNASGCTATASATVTVNQGPAGTLSGSAVLCPNQCATFSFTFTSGSQPYTLTLTASPPGFNFTIPGVNTSQTFQICYQGFLPPNYNPSTNTITIPTFLTGSGSLTLTGISDASGCPGTASGSFSLTLTNAPSANAASITLCETANGQATFNLTSVNGTVTGGGGGLTVNWFQDMAGTIPISNPSSYTTGTTTVYAQVSNGGCTSALVPVTLTVDPSTVPLINMLCASSGTASCEECLTGNTTELQFIFGDNRNYTVTVRNTTTNALTTGIVSNGVNLSVPVSTTTSFVIESIQPVPGCPNTATFSFMVTIIIVSPINIDPLNPPPTCNEFILPAITGTNLSGNQGYFTGAGGTGTQYFPGQSITTSLTLYIYDENAGCEDEETVNIVILPPVTFDPLQDIDGCESAILPAISGTGVSASATYNTAPDGTGTTYLPGATVTQSLTLYTFDPLADPDCVTNSVELEVTIHPLPAPASVDIDCSGGNGNATATITAPTGNEYSYSIDGLPFQASAIITGLTNGSHTITVQNTDTECESLTTFQVSCDCATPAVLNLTPASGTVCSGETFTSASVSYSGNTNEVTLSSNGAGTLSPLTVNSTPFTFTYVPAGADVGKIVLIRLETNDPDGPGPCAPEVRTFSLAVKANPVAIISGPTIVCKGNPVTLSAQGGLTYQWSSNGGSQPVATFPKVDSTTVYSVSVTDAFGCKDDASYTVSIRSITAGRDSTASFCNSVAQIINLNTYLSTTALTGGIWKYGADTLKNATTYPVTSLPIGLQTLRYILSDSLCGKDTALLRINIRNRNNAGADNQLDVCGGDLTEVDFTFLLGQHDVNGRWEQRSGTSLSFADPASVDVSDLAPGQYAFFYIVDGNGCAGDTASLTLTIAPYESAGPDAKGSACIGSIVDLRTYIQNPRPGGVFLNPKSYPGFAGVNWNTTGLSQGSYAFTYRVPNAAPCQADSATIRIDLVPSLNPGSDVTATYCQGEVLDLSTLLSANADKGGVFVVNGQTLSGTLYNTPLGNSSITVQYVVGDDVFCPKKRSLITLTPVQKPVIQMVALPPICEGTCETLTLNNVSGLQVNYYLSAAPQGGGGPYVSQLNGDAQGMASIQVCAASTGPFSINRLPVSSSFTLRVDSFEVLGCVYTAVNSIIVSTRATNTKTFTATLCPTETITVGGIVYSFTKPSGQSLLPSKNPNECDTLVNVQLQFLPEASGTYTETFCDLTRTVTIGNQVFSISKPTGTVRLTGKAANGCDSLVSVSLLFENNTTPGSFTYTTCNLSYTKTIGDATFSFSNPSGVATLKGAAADGCDSLVNVNIVFDTRQIPGTFNYTTCDQSYQVNIGNVTFSSANPSGSAILKGASVEGCDSIVQVNLTFEELALESDVSYACNEAGGLFSIIGCTHPGPYTVTIDVTPSVTVNTLPYALRLTPGVHIVSVVTAAGCATSLRIIIDDNSPPDVTLTQSPLPDGSVQLTATVVPSGSLSTLSWSPAATLSCSNCLNPVASPLETTTYTLAYTYGNDCPDSTAVVVKRINTTVIIPNIFSPDGDGRNDIFYISLPEGITGTVREMSIYDRWGNRVFFAENVPANDPSEGWNGRYKGNYALPGVYVYRLVLNVSGNPVDKVFAGSVTVMK